MFPGKNGHAVKRPTRPLFATVRQLVIVDKRVRYEVRGTPFAEPVKPYRVWCRDRLHARSVDLDHTARADVQRVLGADAVGRLATPSPKPADNRIPSLPQRGDAASNPVDSWWRR